MKKLLFLCICMFTVATTYAKIPIDIKAGLNCATLPASGRTLETETKMRASFYLGLSTQIKLTDKFILQPELVYSRQGEKWDQDMDFYGVHVVETINLDYINIPILVKYEIFDKFSAHIGPQIGLLVSAVGQEEGKDSRKLEAAKTLDFALVAGAEYMVTPRINVSLRCNLGLTPIFEGAPVTTKNRVFQVGVGFKLF